MPPKDNIFHDITDASGFQPSSDSLLLWIIIGIGIVSLLLLGIALLMRHNANKAQGQSVNIAHIALKKLPELQEASLNQPVQQSASDLSTLIRSALTNTTKSPSVYQSQQEFHQKADFTLSDSQLKTDFTDHLDTLWALEYTAPTRDPETMRAHYDTATTLLKKLATHSA